VSFRKGWRRDKSLPLLEIEIPSSRSSTYPLGLLIETIYFNLIRKTIACGEVYVRMILARFPEMLLLASSHTNIEGFVTILESYSN
jgi:hypothetical protein